MLKLLSSSTGIPVSLNELKDDLNIDFNSDDDRLLKLIKRAIDKIEKDTGRALYSQTWEEVLPCFPTCQLELPIVPLSAIDRIDYYNSSNVSTRWGSSVDTPWYLINPTNLPAYIQPKTSYPVSYSRPDAVTVRFTAGNCPERAKQAISFLVACWNENREGGDTSQDYKNLINSLKIGGYY